MRPHGLLLLFQNRARTIAGIDIFAAAGLAKPDVLHSAENPSRKNTDVRESRGRQWAEQRACNKQKARHCRAF
jgi:hypothetical protein